ncbi:hypothetical protein HYX19_03575 [Candidatus Woesearchaeota archaeon]|nr:hypothetical protein [Candidatus Woesearchaeota archaeon]
MESANQIIIGREDVNYKFKVLETDPLKKDIELSSKISKCWQEYLQRNPNAKDEKKIRLATLSVYGLSLDILVLSRGISYSDVVYSRPLAKELESPLLIYNQIISGNYAVLEAKKGLANPIATGVIAVLDPIRSFDVNDVSLLFMVRGNVDMQKGTLSIPNGYVDDIPGRKITKGYLEDEMFRELHEETMISGEEVSYSKALALCQTRFSADLVYLAITKSTPIEVTTKWEINTDESKKEAKKLIIVKAKDVNEKIFNSGIQLNSLVECLKEDLQPDIIQGHLDRINQGI